MKINNIKAELLVKSVNISAKKGTIKQPISKIMLGKEGIKDDAHAGKWHRQVSLLGIESIDKFSAETGKGISYGEFAENITTEGALLYQMQPLDILKNEKIELEITQIGKKCHGDNCSIFKEVGNCVMPKEGIFARVISGGELQAGDILNHYPKVYQAAVITLSDRASAGEYKDISGRVIEKKLSSFFEEKSLKFQVTRRIIPDEPDDLLKQLKEFDNEKYDLIITCGGTGIGPRDITPDVVKPFLDKEIPGIMEHIRTKYGNDLPPALLSRSIAGIKGTAQIYTLPGSTKAVEEYLNEILKVLQHAFLMVHGLGH